jgi:hypothetical protein
MVLIFIFCLDFVLCHVVDSDCAIYFANTCFCHDFCYEICLDFCFSIVCSGLDSCYDFYCAGHCGDRDCVTDFCSVVEIWLDSDRGSNRVRCPCCGADHQRGCTGRREILVSHAHVRVVDRVRDHAARIYHEVVGLENWTSMVVTWDWVDARQ